jgi:putative toxin-antitoxin system antitoxin component (TIGR02293 family)
MIHTKQTTTDHYQKLTSVLGKKYICTSINNPFDIIQIASKGVNSNVVKNFRNYFDLPRESTAHLLNISEPTLYRWIKANKNLDRNSSVKLFEIADLFLHGTEVFGDKEAFFQWMNMPNKSIGGMQPMELVELPEGVSKVKDILGRIEYGVFG